MLKPTSVLVAAIGLFSSSAPLAQPATAEASAQVHVRVTSPEALAQAGVDVNERSRQARQIEQALRSRIQVLASECLDPTHRLEIVLTEVNPAGFSTQYPLPPRSDVRVVRGGWASSLTLQYQLATADHLVIERGSERLRTSGYAGTDPTARIGRTGYAEEQALIAEWFSRRFCVRATTR